MDISQKKLDRKRLKVLSLLQSQLPVSIEPYKEIALLCDITEEETLAIIKELKMGKYIRRIGAILDGSQIDYTSTLCAVKAPKSDIQRIATILNQEQSVTHNYERAHEYSLWFTFIEKKEKIQSSLVKLEDKIGYSIVCFPAIKKYKSRVMLELK